jgi:uncharacterized protein (TIGR02996 family)
MVSREPEMDEQAGILRAIVENPDDVTHRLVYADWLEEHGQERFGEFIRAHCALRPFLVNPKGDVQLPGAVEIMTIQPDLRPELLKAFQPVYEDLNETGEPLDAVLPRHFGLWVQRGLLEYLQIYGGNVLAVFNRHAKRIFASVPLLHLGISTASGREGWTFYTPFSVHNAPASRVGIRAMRALLKRPEIVRLRSLDLSNLRLGNALGDSLLRAPDGFRPQRLVLGGNQIQEAMAERLRQRFDEALVLPPYSIEDDFDIPF